MGIQARQLARYAKKHGIPVARYGQSTNEDQSLKHCVLGILSHIAGETADPSYKDTEIVQGLTRNQRLGLEDGFEGYGNDHDKRYYKVGRNFARLMNLPPKG